MSEFNLMNQSTQCTELEIDDIVPRMKLRDEVFVFVDGKWVNETCCQSPFATHQKLFRRMALNEWSIWEENRALWEENQVLRIENRMLREENKALKCLQSQNKTFQVICTDAIQQSLQKENKPFPFFQEINTGFQVSPGNKALQAVWKKHRVSEDFQQENKTIPIIRKHQKAVTVHEESKDATSDLQKDADTITAVEEGNPGLAPQLNEVENKSTTATENKIKCAPSAQDNYEILQALWDLYKFLHVFLKVNNFLGEKQDCHILYDVDRSFQEDYNKLKIQLNALKNTVSDIKAQMEMLEEELIAITSPMYEEAETEAGN